MQFDKSFFASLVLLLFSTTSFSVQYETPISGNVSAEEDQQFIDIVYVIDVSGSTRKAGNDCNSDGRVDDGDNFTPADGGIGTVLDCEVGAVMALNDELTMQDSISVSAIVFGRIADSVLEFAEPAADSDSDGVSDLDQLLIQLNQGGGVVSVGKATRASAAAKEVKTLFASSDSRKIAILLSDGRVPLALSGSRSLKILENAGIQVESFIIGEATSGDCENSELGAISASTGGLCIKVEDITTLGPHMAAVVEVARE